MTIPATFKSAGLVDTATLSKALGAASAVMNEDSGGAFDGRDLLKICQDDGTWVYGMDEMQIDATDRIAVNPSSFKHGFVSWKESKIAGEAMVSIIDTAPVESTLPNTGKPWVRQYSYEAVTLVDGAELLFKNSSMGAAKAIKSLFKELQKAIATHPTYYVPVISLSSTSYVNKNYANKTIYNPIFTVEDWADVEGKLMSKAKADEKAAADEIIPEEIVQTDAVETADDSGELDIEKVDVNAKAKAEPETKTEPPKTARRTRASRG